MDIENDKLNLDLPWRIGEKSFLKIIDLIHDKINHLDCLIEFGSGASTIRLALRFPQAQIISFDADFDCYKQTLALSKEFLKDQALLNLKYQPLSFKNYGKDIILSYTQDDSLTELSIDCVIIDGPPFYTLRGREACLYQVYDYLRIGGIVILDDFSRENEKTILKNWLSVYPNSFDVEIMDVGHHLAILQKRKVVQPIWLNFSESSTNSNNKYKMLMNALLNLKNADLRKIFYSLPDQIIIPIAKNKEDFGELLKLILTIRTVYEGISSQSKSILNSDSGLFIVQENQSQADSLICCLELMNLC